MLSTLAAFLELATGIAACASPSSRAHVVADPAIFLAEQPEARSLGGQRAMAMRSVAGVIAAIFGVTLLDLVACSRLQGRLGEPCGAWAGH